MSIFTTLKKWPGSIYYYRGLSEWTTEKGFLIETARTAQDRYKKQLDYFEIPYKSDEEGIHD